MKRKAISVILIMVTSVFLMFSIGCSGSSSNESSTAGVSGSAS